MTIASSVKLLLASWAWLKARDNFFSPPNQKPYLFTEAKYPSYPNGYQVEELGADRGRVKRRLWGKANQARPTKAETIKQPCCRAPVECHVRRAITPNPARNKRKNTHC